MGSLSDKELKRAQSELMKEGVSEVIDAQNVKDYIRKKRMKQGNAESGAYNRTVAVQDEEPDLLEQFAMGEQEREAILRELSNNTKKKDDTSIEEIDWKNVRTF